MLLIITVNYCVWDGFCFEKTKDNIQDDFLEMRDKNGYDKGKLTLAVA